MINAYVVIANNNTTNKVVVIFSTKEDVEKFIVLTNKIYIIINNNHKKFNKLIDQWKKENPRPIVSLPNFDYKNKPILNKNLRKLAKEQKESHPLFIKYKSDIKAYKLALNKWKKENSKLKNSYPLRYKEWSEKYKIINNNYNFISEKDILDLFPEKWSSISKNIVKLFFEDIKYNFYYEVIEML